MPDSGAEGGTVLGSATEGWTVLESATEGGTVLDSAITEMASPSSVNWRASLKSMPWDLIHRLNALSRLLHKIRIFLVS